MACFILYFDLMMVLFYKTLVSFLKLWKIIPLFAFAFLISISVPVMKCCCFQIVKYSPPLQYNMVFIFSKFLNTSVWISKVARFVCSVREMSFVRPQLYCWPFGVDVWNVKFMNYILNLPTERHHNITQAKIILTFPTLNLFKALEFLC